MRINRQPPARWIAAAAAFVLLAHSPAAAAPPGREIIDFDQEPLYAYGSWEKPAMSGGSGPVEISGVDAKGGFGYNVSPELSAAAQNSPVLTLTLGPANKAKRLKLLLIDADGTNAQFYFDLPQQPGPATVVAVDGASLAQPNEISKDGENGELDLDAIAQVQLIGDWQATNVDARFGDVTAVPADADVQARRAARAERRAADRAAKEKAMQDALANLERGEDAPTVEHVAALAPDLLQLTIQAGHIPPVELQPYAEQPGDEVRPNDHMVVAWTDGPGEGELALVGEHVSLYRDGKHVGFLTGSREQMLPVEKVVGDELQELLVDRAEGYAVRSSDDSAYSSPTRPVEVYRKSKPTNHTHPDRDAAMAHRVILKLPEPMKEGATYTIELSGVNTKQETVEYTHEPRNVRSDAIHASQVGYRPGDPLKVAYLSTWLGTGGGLEYDVDSFELIDEGGKTVFTGEVKEAKGEGEAEKLLEDKDYAMTAVYALDFSDFDGSGTFRVFVPGVGTSGLVPIAEDAWREAFKVSMTGLLHHRSGIELGAPFTDYERPRPHHPDDGFEVYELDIPLQTGMAEDVNAAAKRILESGRLPPTRDSAWGGYMDAGDYDRRSQHLEVTYLLLELFELFPEYYEGVKLALPPEEAKNELPDVLDEALFNLAHYRRLQRDDGGVGGGVEASAHPRDAEVSWNESLFLGTFTPDPVSTQHFAACAAKFARLAEKYDSELAADYKAAAIKAFDWAEANLDEFVGGGQASNLTELRKLAAVEMLHLTGEDRYHETFKTLSPLDGGDGEAHEHPAFAYTLLPQNLGDAAIKQAAERHVVGLADRSVEFGQGNAFGISTPYPDLPVIGFVSYFSAPGIVSRCLPRAHRLTGDDKYLAGTIRSANFSAGANPDNLSYTTGVGWRDPKNPLHLDHRRTGQPAPTGITVYGPTDPANGYAANEWMHTWFLGEQMTPPSREWPVQESYVDVFMWPVMNEYTVMQTIAPTAYTWGYLAASGR